MDDTLILQPLKRGFYSPLSGRWQIPEDMGQRTPSLPKASMTGLEFKMRCSILSAILWLSQDVGEAATTA